MKDLKQQEKERPDIVLWGLGFRVRAKKSAALLKVRVACKSCLMMQCSALPGLSMGFGLPYSAVPDHMDS